MQHAKGILCPIGHRAVIGTTGLGSISEVQKIQRQHKIIGRTEELEQAVDAILAKKHILIEGPVGVGKTVIAEALSRHFERNIYRIDGDERYTEQKLVGWFDPPLVISQGYSKNAFIEGPLTQAMMEGAFLFINELNRMPEGTQNVLLPAMDERRIVIPRIGKVCARDGFVIIATQNPEEYIGTSRLSEALKDRFVWIRLDYQSEVEEIKIVKKETCSNDDDLVRIATKVTRKTRENTDIRRGASVRGAIDIVSLIMQKRKKPIKSLNAAEKREMLEKAAIAALVSKVEVREGSHEKIITIIKQFINEELAELQKRGKNQALDDGEKGDIENF
jgi:MoxR-like ATPase